MFDASKIVLSDTDSCEKALANENGEVTRAVLTAYRIRKTRLSANMPQKDLAEKIGVRKQTLLNCISHHTAICSLFCAQRVPNKSAFDFIVRI